MSYQIDLEKKGLEMFFKPWQIAALNCLNDVEEPKSSREVHEEVLEKIPGTVSRASIINFLNQAVEQDLLEYEITTGKGGHYRLYQPKYSGSQLIEYLARVVYDKLMMTWPEETKNTVNQILR